MICGLRCNDRGITNKGTITFINSILMKYDISFCAILEPKVISKRLLSVARKLGFSGTLYGHPLNTHVWILYKDPIMVASLKVSNQHISCMVTHCNSTVAPTCSVIYASNKVVNRAKLWSDLTDEADHVLGLGY